MTSGYTEFAKPEVTETIISSINSLWFSALCWGSARMLSLLVSRMFSFLLNPTYPACLCLFISSACCFCLFFFSTTVTSAALSVFRFVSFICQLPRMAMCFLVQTSHWIQCVFALLQINIKPDLNWQPATVWRWEAESTSNAHRCCPSTDGGLQSNDFWHLTRLHLSAYSDLWPLTSTRHSTDAQQMFAPLVTVVCQPFRWLWCGEISQ